jgi:hypothetical protein
VKRAILNLTQRDFFASTVCFRILAQDNIISLALTALFKASLEHV